jgi:hypothetical protein
MVSRRDLVFAIPLLVGVCARRSFASIPTQAAPVTRSDLDKLLDTTHPELHCKMNHDHNDTTFDDWEGSLKWSATDCGYNEAAGAVIKLAVKSGLSYPELMCGCPDSERLIPQVNEVLRNPDALDQYAGVGLASPSQIADLKNMVKRGVPPTEVLASAPEEAVDEVWRRKAMMRFASTLAKRGSLAPATAIATASQWHNCQAFKCLLRHPSEVAHWLQDQRTQECNPAEASVQNPHNRLR